VSRPEEVADSVRRILEDTAPAAPARPFAFGDSIDENLAVLREVLSQMPLPAKRRARAASVAIEETITRLQRESPDGATAMGVLLAALVVSQRLIEGQRDAHGASEPSLVQIANG